MEVTPSRRRWSTALIRFALPALLLATLLFAPAGCRRNEPPPRSACDDLVITEDGLTREVYGPCAGEILAAMDALRPELEGAVDGDEEAERRARRAYRKVRKLIKSAGGKDLLQEWRDRRLTDLNSQLYKAYTNYWACTISPSESELREAAQHHDAARRIYDSL